MAVPRDGVWIQTFMKRRNLFAAMFGIGAASAQQWKECAPSKESRFICSDETKPALNGQCPACGTMAEPFKAYIPQAGISFGNSGDYLRAIWYKEPRITRCIRCNAAFWQDAEN